MIRKSAKEAGLLLILAFFSLNAGEITSSGKIVYTQDSVSEEEIVHAKPKSKNISSPAKTRHFKGWHGAPGEENNETTEAQGVPQ